MNKNYLEALKAQVKVLMTLIEEEENRVLVLSTKKTLSAAELAKILNLSKAAINYQMKKGNIKNYSQKDTRYGIKISYDEIEKLVSPNGPLHKYQKLWNLHIKNNN